MFLTRSVIVLSTAVLMVAGLTCARSAAAQEAAVAKPPVSRQLPSVIEPTHLELLRTGQYEAARRECEVQINSSALVTEPGVLAGPYTCLGEALFGLGRFEAAALAFNNAIDQLERSAGVFDPRLVQPLDGLGKTLMRLGRLEGAENALVKAKDLTHRNFGIYNLVQTGIVNRLTKTYYDRGELSSASREQRFLLRANEETYGEAPQLLPAIRRMARWYERIGRHDLARDHYRRALQIMERAYGPDDLRLAGPLRDFARSYTNTPRGANRVMSRAGANALMDVIRLYERQEFTDAVDLAQSWGELGDWYVIGGRRKAARDAYREAGRVLQEAGVQDDRDLFSQPVEIEYEDVPIGLRTSRVRELPEGIAVLEFEFTVTEEGRVADLAVVRDDLDYTRFALEVGQRVKASRYRPRIVNGEPVATPGVRKTLRYDLRRRLPQVPTVVDDDGGSVDAGVADNGESDQEREEPVSSPSSDSEEPAADPDGDSQRDRDDERE